ncbi:serine protease [Streptomyces sp. HPF1205]|uniref:trypsin-like serine peptidase n=1 Tax=Streptomyces sp. HPF1205 TaxID=2873262 RepID=UPI001CEC46F4|nr:hypothetical protein [Streptomyces sp. HPF1205]
MPRFSGATLTGLAVAALMALGTLTAVPAAADDGPGAPPGTPTATRFDGIATVGPLFRGGLDHDHSCTASVVAAPGHDLILAAAHCVRGTAAGWLFAPGYDAGRTPYGVWTVTGAYVDPKWSRDQDPRYDYAILRVADQERDGREVGVQDVTGANVLGLAPPAGQEVTDVAYNSGIGDQPVRCTVPVYYTGGFPSFDCHGYVGGSSGSPWLATVPGTRRTAVVGLIGGLHQGGCYEYTSYSPAFRLQVYALVLRATLGVPPDTVPAAGGDGC